MITYTVTSQEGADRYGAEVDQEIELELPVDEKRAVVAAGWITPKEKKGGK